MVRIAGYWLLYAVVGVLVVIFLLIGGGDLGSEDAKSPIRPNTKVIGALNGLAIGAALVGLYMTRDPSSNHAIGKALLYGGAPCAAILGVWAWIRIASDLKKRRNKR